MPTNNKIQPNAFGIKLSEYITNSGYSVYKLAQITGLGRTAIQHAISGKFVPTLDFVEKLCTELPLTPKQRVEFLRLYKRAKIGDKLFYQRERIHKLINELPNYCVDACVLHQLNEDIQIQCNQIINGTINVNNALKELIVSESNGVNPCVSTTMPHDNRLFFDMLLQIPVSKNNMTFNHYFKMYKDDSENENLDILENSLKISMNSAIHYHPYYSYDYKESNNDFISLFPYCLVTSKFTAQISKDYNSAYICDGNDIIENAAAHLKKLEQYSNLMLDVVSDKDMFNIFAASTSIFSCSIEYQPCLTAYMTADIVSKRLKNIPEKDNILTLLNNYFFTEDAIKNTAAQKQNAILQKAD